jgi:hypothetical protein
MYEYTAVWTHSLIRFHSLLAHLLTTTPTNDDARTKKTLLLHQFSLVKADFTNANLRGASLEDTSMDEAILENAVAIGSYFSRSILDAANLSNVDFTDASFPPKALALLCQRSDVMNGTTNPVTGVSTSESLQCP